MNLEAIVFVFRSRASGEIRCEYLEQAKTLAQSPDWEHLATLDPRLWVQYHWQAVEASE